MSAPTPVVALHEVERVHHLAGADVRAVRGVSLSFAAGDSVALVGQSGSGKSTLLHLMGAVDLPTSGSVTLFGEDTQAMSDARRTQLRLTRVGFVFQRFFLLPMLTAAENVALPMMEAGVPRAERQQRVIELLHFVGLSHRLGHRPAQMSGGEMQRVAIARALANRPALLLADEPTGELDEATGEEIAQLLLRVAREGTTLVMATHNLALAERLSRVVRLRDGRVVDDTAGAAAAR